ncbi:MAG: UDP-N-acetylmuramoylalanyl-D-glutamate--2,6-diaminopimelate ligase, partial [Gammaproteobacteria bacterium]|nr:UDP-N-acetylmuramoylalanyl-D-glutamate--2,6-diaminopimelate ligase [Gammaproteobacteria bacterium]
MTAAAKPLAALLEGWVPAQLAADDVIVKEIGLDSRELREGALFLACRGRRTHGLAAARQAIEHGARAIAYEPADDLDPALLDGLRAEGKIALVAVPDLSRQASRIAARFFDAPSQQLRVAGITGTNG